MTEHDIICPQYQTGIPRGEEVGCRCGIINLARDNERARLRITVDEFFAGFIPPYLFPEAKEVLFPGLENTTVYEAIEEVWRYTRDNVRTLFDEEV